MQQPPYFCLTNEELLRLPTVRNDLDPLAREALDRLSSALDEIDNLTRRLRGNGSNS